jgi:hypothetical protein
VSRFIHHYAECHYAECRYAECHCAECHYDECRYAECHGAASKTSALFKYYLEMMAQSFDPRPDVLKLCAQML